MRFAKLFFLLLFGAVFLLTLMKVLVFGLFAAMVFGGIFLASRAFGSRRFKRHQRQWAMAYGPMNQFDPFIHQQSPFEQPLNSTWQKRPAAQPFGRRIEVL